MANFADIAIDYPNAREYAFDIFERMAELKILDEDKLVKYKKHIENVLDDDYEY